MLVKEQYEFTQDVRRLLDYIASCSNFIVTFGEAYRTPEQQKIYVQKGLSRTENSRHMVRMAIDLNFFKEANGKLELTYDKEELQHIGDFWESLSPNNRWGGNWKFVDTPHFERGKRER